MYLNLLLFLFFASGSSQRQVKTFKSYPKNVLSSQKGEAQLQQIGKAESRVKIRTSAYSYFPMRMEVIVIEEVEVSTRPADHHLTSRKEMQLTD